MKISFSLSLRTLCVQIIVLISLFANSCSLISLPKQNPAEKYNGQTSKKLTTTPTIEVKVLEVSVPAGNMLVSSILYYTVAEFPDGEIHYIWLRAKTKPKPGEKFKIRAMYGEVELCNEAEQEAIGK